jgi:hypothetical protein
LAAALALHIASHEPASYSPSSDLTSELLGRLEVRGLITRADISVLLELPDFTRTLYDPIAFRWLSADGAAFSEGHLKQLLRARVSALETTSEVLGLWRTLATAELQGYYAYLLRKHQLPVAWAISVRRLSLMWFGKLTLSQMRYSVWCSVRAGTSAYMSSGGDLDGTRRHIDDSLRKRMSWVAQKSPPGSEFVPTQRNSVLLDIFLEDIARIGTDYWLALPTADALRRVR